MKKIVSLFCLILSLYHYSFGQPGCNDDMIMNKKGSWKKVSDANPFPDNSFPKSQFAQAQNRIDKMQKLLNTTYPEPKGIEAQWYRSISGDALVKGGPVPYELEALFLAYYCNDYENKIESGGETSTWFYVWANQFNWFANYINIYTVHKLPVYLLNKRAGVINGYPVYEGYNIGKPSEYIHNRAVILTRPGQSPYLPVTQKQFLRAFVNYHEKRNPRLLAEVEKNATILSDEEEESIKKKQLEKIEKTIAPERLAKVKENYLKNYITSKQRKEISIAQTKKFQEDELNPARTLLADTLVKNMDIPAILDYTNVLEFKKFSTEEEGGQELVRLNPGYFNIALPKYIPQLLIVYWSWDENKPAGLLRTLIEKNFNFNALREMIDK